MRSSFTKLLKREFSLSLSNILLIFFNQFFYCIGVIIFIIAIGTEEEILRKTAFGIIWTLVIFTILFSVEQFFVQDYRDGSLKELQTIGYSPEVIIITKLITMWFFIILPILTLTPVLTIMLPINFQNIKILLFSLILGSPSLLMIATIAEILTIQAKKSKVIILILVFPLYVPVLIFGVGSNKTLINGQDPLNNFFILFAFFLITLPITIISGKLALKELNN